MTIAFWFWIIGGLVYLIPFNMRQDADINELGKWAFIVGLAAWFLGH